MFFQIVPVHRHDVSGMVRKRWVYRDGTEKNPGDAVCQSYGTFATEADARSDIAVVKNKMKASRFAKVDAE